jgi:ribosomal-protein-serine acetyltransferase
METVRFWDCLFILEWTMFRAPLPGGFELRLLEERHASHVFSTVNVERAYLRQWLPWVDSTVREDDSLVFIRASLEQFASNHGFAAGLWDGPEFIGVIGMHRINWLNRSVEIGYWIAQDYQGKGIVTEACRAVVTHVFEELDLHRVQIRCATGNTKSCAIPKRLGFVHEGTVREAEQINGKYFDLHIFGMLKRNWIPEP